MGKADSEYEEESTWSRNYPGKVVMMEDMRLPSPEKAYIVGVILGDASVHSGGMSKAKKISLNTIDKEFAEEFAQEFCKWANLRWEGWNSDGTEVSTVGPIEKDGNAKDVWMVSKGISEVYEHLKSYTSKGHTSILDEFKNFHADLLRGLWDSEGHVSEGATKVTFTTTDDEISRLYSKLVLSCIGVHPKEYDKDSNYCDNAVELRLHKEDGIVFYKTVQPTIKRKTDRFQEVLS